MYVNVCECLYICPCISFFCHTKSTQYVKKKKKKSQGGVVSARACECNMGIVLNGCTHGAGLITNRDRAHFFFNDELPMLSLSLSRLFFNDELPKRTHGHRLPPQASRLCSYYGLVCKREGFCMGMYGNHCGFVGGCMGEGPAHASFSHIRS